MTTITPHEETPIETSKEPLEIEDIGAVEELAPEEVEAIGPSYPIANPDVARVMLAFSFVAIFSLTILGAFVLFACGHPWEQVKDLINLLLPAETALLGSAVGFYFGTRQQ